MNEITIAHAEFCDIVNNDGSDDYLHIETGLQYCAWHRGYQIKVLCYYVVVKQCATGLVYEFRYSTSIDNGVPLTEPMIDVHFGYQVEPIEKTYTRYQRVDGSTSGYES